MNPFRSRIRSALADTNLQTALDNNAERRAVARGTGYVSLPENLSIMRKQAYIIRSDVIVNLDKYLDRFIDRVSSNGIMVHRAKDSSDAVKIVFGIIRQHGFLPLNRNTDPHRAAKPSTPSCLIAKSKTMVSEEIRLNNALESAGFCVVETDLGEYIVQLRGEGPSHIITPAVHLRREDVGVTFHEKLGIPYTDDIPTLTNTARKTLRQTFLNANIGLSGVNFGVVETGTICVLTNEGNGRMVTTIPPVHIALMGIERLVPTMDDLAIMIDLLPRSATGQKITVYSQLIHSPKRPEEPDGPQERHLILVDNGRSKIRQSPISEILLCIRCGACLNVCPVFREIGGHAYIGAEDQPTPYPGPMGSIVSPGLFGQKNFAHLAQATTLCGACNEACPVDIDLPKLLLRVRAGGTELQSDKNEKHHPEGLSRMVFWGLKLFSWISKNPRRFAFSQKLAGISGRIISPWSEWLRLPAFTGWGYSKDFPRPATSTFRERWIKSLENDPSKRFIVDNTPEIGFDVLSKEAEDQLRSGTFQSPMIKSSTSKSMVDQFKEEIIALSGGFTLCSQDQLPDEIIKLLNARGITDVLAWEKEELPSGLPDALLQRGIRITHDPNPNIQAGLTGALAAIADTGTLVLTTGQGKLSTASLLPDLHIAILHAHDIYTNLAKVLNLDKVINASAAVLISGPSRTADIEMTLTIGAHGPAEVHVFCIQD